MTKPSDWGVENDIRIKEIEMAKERGVKVVTLKAQREKLERERERIMDDLERLKLGGNALPPRRNEAARFVADQQLKNPTPISFNYGNLEPSLKEKLIND